jgi:enoyl-CoA hydratase
VPAAGSDLIRLERRGAIALLGINHPPVNVLSAAVLDALLERVREVEADESLRVVVLHSVIDRLFAAGADVSEMAGLSAEGATIHGGRGQRVTRALELLPLPVVAAVHGVCLGGGCEIAQACDIIVASEDAVFGQPEIRLGVMPGWGGTQRLPRWIGAAQARDWIFTGRNAKAEEALAAGLVSRVVARAELLPTALLIAEELAGRPALALAAAKYAVNRSVEDDLDNRLDYELSLWARLFGTKDQREGMNAFLEKRSWTTEGRAGWSDQSQEFPWRGEPGRNEGKHRTRERQTA